MVDMDAVMTLLVPAKLLCNFLPLSTLEKCLRNASVMDFTGQCVFGRCGRRGCDWGGGREFSGIVLSVLRWPLITPANIVVIASKSSNGNLVF